MRLPRVHKTICGSLVVFLVIILCGAANAQTEPVISGDFMGQNLDRVFKQIKKDHQVKFAYDSRAMRARECQVELLDVPLGSALSLLLKDSDYSWKNIGGTYVIFPELKNDAIESPTRKNFTLEGVVVDAQTGEPLPFATIQIRSSSVVSANQEGRFTMFNVPSDTSLLVVSYIGYAVQSVRLNPTMANGTAVIELIQDRALLPIAPVYGEQTRTLKLESRVGDQLINVDALKSLPNFGEPDVVRSLQLLPGIRATGESSGSLTIRGGASDENLVIYDGFTIYHLDHFYGIFSAFNSQSIKNIKLHKGWFPSKLGGRTAGVIEITGKEGNRKQTHVSLGGNLMSTNLLLEAPLVTNQVTFFLAGRRSFTDVIFSPVYRNLFSNLYNSSISANQQGEIDPFANGSAPNFHFYDVTSKLSIRPSARDVVQLSFYAGQDQLNINYPFSDENAGVLIDYQDDSQWGNLGSSFKWSRKWNRQWFTNVVGSYSTYSSFLNANDRTTDLDFGIKDSTRTNRSGDLTELSLKFESELSWYEHNVGLGVWSTYQEVQYVTSSSDGYKGSLFESAGTIAFYLQDDFKINSSLSAHVGSRLTFYERNNTAYVEPRLALEWCPIEKLQLKAGLGRYTQAIRRIRRQDLFLNTPDFWRLSDGINIPVLISDQWQIGFQIPAKKWVLDVEYYERYLQGVVADPLQYNFQVADQLSGFWTGTSVVRGVDAMLQRTIGRHTGWLSASVSKAVEKYNELDQDEVYSASDERLELNAVYLLKFPHWTFSMTGVYGSGRPTTPLIGFYELEHLNGTTTTIPVRGEVNSARLPAYHRLDFSAHYNFVLGGGQAELGFSVFNLLNRNNVRETQYFLSQNAGEALIVNEKQLYHLGILPAISFTISY